MIALAKPDNIIAMTQKSNEWYTPARYIDAAREVMGSIDLDPASCELANRTVKAKQFYTVKENGLAQEWHGNVWLNPPFTGTQSRGVWSKELIKRYLDGYVHQAILVMPASPDTAWFWALWEYPICFPYRRMSFLEGDKGKKHNPSFPSCLVYLGPHEQTFIEVFSQFGTIAKRVSQPKQQIQPLQLWEVQ